MSGALSLGLPCPLEPIDARLISSDSAGAHILWLRDSLGLFYAARGDANLRAKREERAFRGGEAVLRGTRGAERVTLQYHGETELYVVRFRLPESPRCPDCVRVPEHVAVARPERLTDLLRRYLGEQRRPGSSRLVLYHLAVLALCELASSDAKGGRTDEPGLEIIASRVDAFIAAHYREVLGTLEIARGLRYNPDYLERVYRQERRLSIREAIHERRIKEASAQLLLQGERAVAEIAELCGYNDASYFRRVFKRLTNMTPKSYRSRLASGRGRRAVRGPSEGAAS